MEELKPGELTKVRTLARGLEVRPLCYLVDKRGGGGRVGEGVGIVVGGDEVRNDGVRLEKGYASVGVVNS